MSSRELSSGLDSQEVTAYSGLCGLGNDPKQQGIMPKELAKRKAAGVDNTNRRTWDVDEYADKAATREAEVGTMIGSYTACKCCCTLTKGIHHPAEAVWGSPLLTLHTQQHELIQVDCLWHKSPLAPT